MPFKIKVVSLWHIINNKIPTMAKFFLRTPLQKGVANLYLRVHRPKLKINWLVCSFIKIDVEAWRKAEGNTNALIRYFATEKGKEVQKQMEIVEGVISELFEDNVIKRNEDKAILERAIKDVVNADAKNALEEVKKRKQEEEEKRLHYIINYYDYFLKGITNGDILQKRGAKAYREGTVTAWRSFGKFLKGYTPQDMTFEEINKKFADGFVLYLEKQGLMAKTINKQILCFRRLCNAAAVDEKNKNLISVRVWTERTVKDKEKRAEIALNESEIDALYDMPLEGIREAVRDVWCLGYFSGQRVSDYAHFTRENFKRTKNGVNVIVLQQVKTGNEVVVPITDERVNELCAKYDYNFPRVETRTINRYIKEVLQMLSVNVPTLREWTRTQLSMAERQKEKVYLQMQRRIDQGERLHGEELKRYNEMRAYAIEHDSGNNLWKRDFAGNVVKQKWECVSCHTSRRSAVTSMYDSGLYDVREMMSISGHQTLKNFEGYVKRGAIEQAERIAAKAAAAKAKRTTKRKEA